MTDTTQGETRVWERGQPITPPATPPPQAQAGNGGAQPQAAPQPEIPRPEAQEKTKEGPWVGTLKLRKKVRAFADMIDELKFREPTGGDIEDIGNPIVVGAGRMQFDAPVMTGMMSHLAAVPPSTIRALHPRDWTNGAYMLATFFMPDQ